jgi:hypothetical protein
MFYIFIHILLVEYSQTRVFHQRRLISLAIGCEVVEEEAMVIVEFTVYIPS